jgi:hypothetical protein
MSRKPRVRKAFLVTHVCASVGWLGAVVAFLGLAIASVASDDIELVRAAALTVETLAWWVLLPLSALSLITGLIQSLGTHWGLFRHYWVTVKLVINLVSTVVLLLYTGTVSHYADVAADATVTDIDLMRSNSAVIHAAAALVLLVIATILSVYKPTGLTRRGQRRQRAEGEASTAV